MAVINAVGNALTGSTGSGAFVGQTSPSLITPNLGAASATSINFGGGAYNNYVPSTAFASLPAFTFDTPGDLSVVYTTQTGFYTQDGNIMNVIINLSFTPTFTTSSGNIRITNFPVAPSASISSYLLNATNGATPTYGAGRTMFGASISSGNTYASVVTCGSAVAQLTLTTANVTSGVAAVINIQGFYLI